MKPLGRNELREVFTLPNGTIKRVMESYCEEGVEIVFSNSFIEECVDRAYTEQLGARSVANTVESLLQPYEYKILTEDIKQVYFEEIGKPAVLKR